MLLILLILLTLDIFGWIYGVGLSRQRSLPSLSSQQPLSLSPNFQAENIINITVKLRWSWSSMEKSQPDLLLSKPGKQGNQSGNHQHKTRILHLTNLIFILWVVNCPTGWFLYLSLRDQIEAALITIMISCMVKKTRVFIHSFTFALCCVYPFS